MVKWIVSVFLLGLIGFGGYVVYEMEKYGYFDVPEMPENSFPVSINSGFRGVMVGFGGDEGDRDYKGIGNEDTPSWYTETWSTCRRPTDEEMAELNEKTYGPGWRWEAICEIDADGDVFIRGFVGSVPSL